MSFPSCFVLGDDGHLVFLFFYVHGYLCWYKTIFQGISCKILIQYSINVDRVVLYTTTMPPRNLAFPDIYVLVTCISVVVGQMWMNVTTTAPPATTFATTAFQDTCVFVAKVSRSTRITEVVMVVSCYIHQCFYFLHLKTTG